MAITLEDCKGKMCSNCFEVDGFEMEDGDIFCGYCGEMITEAEDLIEPGDDDIPEDEE